ncbi:hypothetical protein O0I10_001111 [Lichtheimia ornata]|uniref:EXPERA domain-containing protein n=1 Tax=Lichtheimia ornata TaxID=688661 RepID=A0AAD7Y356_9FUNG|nr:uncharacterized protein O0I10_001111 [Lichtheimia ornata]KAJ8662935.1 hypothetical protein O0I10_001111 [Lichtheimia ornata]
MATIPDNNLHPYYPRTAEIPGYIPNALPMPLLLGAVLIAMGTIVKASFFAARFKSKSLQESLRFTWFTLCTTLHCGFEAYWIYHHRSIASRTDFFAELWKEYAHGDSRYLTHDELLLALETITVCIWGPLCFMAARAIWKQSPQQYLWQLMASMAHLFSTVLYFVMDWPQGFPNCDPHPLYFWIYFVAFNSPWLIVPALLFKQSLHAISSALHASYPKAQKEE